VTDQPGPGCEFCRHGSTTQTEVPLTNLGLAVDRKSYVFRCVVCGTFWDEGEAYPKRISLARARELLPDLELS
jgi:hypothetical protein